MLDFGKSSTWYGRLETSTKSIMVIFDPKLPQAPTGQIYLFNAERGTIVKYMWSVVSERLRDLTAEEKKAAQDQLEKDWKAARRSFLKTNHHPQISKVRAPQPAAKPPVDEDEMESEDFEEDSVEFDDEE